MKKIDVTEWNTVGVICLSAMAAKERVGQDITSVFGRGPICEVEMRINGVEVDVVEALTAIYERESARINHLAAKKALEMITSVGLDSIRDAISDADWKIREARDAISDADWKIREALRQKFPEDYAD